MELRPPQILTLLPTDVWLGLAICLKDCFGRSNVWDVCVQHARAEAQTKKMLDVGKKLDAETHVFWGGREGFATALNTKDRSALRCTMFRRVKWIEMCRCECEILLQRVITYNCCRSRASLTTWPHSWKWRWLTKRKSDLVHNSPLSQKLVSQLHINMTMTPKRSLVFCISWEPRKGMEQRDPCIHRWLVGLHCVHLQFHFKSFPKLGELDQCNENFGVCFLNFWCFVLFVRAICPPRPKAWLAEWVQSQHWTESHDLSRQAAGWSKKAKDGRIFCGFCIYVSLNICIGSQVMITSMICAWPLPSECWDPLIAMLDSLILDGILMSFLQTPGRGDLQTISFRFSGYFNF